MYIYITVYALSTAYIHTSKYSIYHLQMNQLLFLKLNYQVIKAIFN